VRRCVLYSRVSTDAQERDGTSLDTQERACVEYAAAQGWTVVERVSDTASGFTLDRTGIDRVRELARSGGCDVVLTYALDRLSRKQTHIGILVDEMESLAVRLEFVTEKFEDTATGQLLRSVKAFAAEFEREKIAERTMRGKAERARSGRIPQATGKGLFGYRYDPESGQRSVHEEQAGTVLRIFECFAVGESCDRIANDLNAHGIPAFRGGPWYALTVRRVLMNETYTGRTVYRRTKVEKVRDVVRGKWKRRVVERDSSDWIEVTGATPAIVTSELFAQVQARLNDPARAERARPSTTYPLRGRLHCAECGAAMVGQALDKGRYHYYRCRQSYTGPRGRRCSSRYVRKERLEEAIRSALLSVLSDPERILDEARRARDGADTAGQRSRLDREIADVEERQRRLIRLYTAGDLPQEMLAEESGRLSALRTRLESERAALTGDTPGAFDLQRLAVLLPEAVAVVRRWVEQAEGADLQLMLRAFDAEIRVSSEDVKIRGSVPVIRESDQADLVTTEQTSA